MSTDSFNRYKEELAQNVTQEAAAAARQKALHRPRRASTESDLRNERWGNFSSPEMRRSSRGQLKTIHRAQKSLSLDDGLDNLVQSFISSFHDGDEQRNRTSAHLIQSKLSKSEGQMIDMEGSSSDLKSGLSSEELKVLTNMMRRLSNSESDGYSEQEDLCDGEVLSSDPFDSANPNYHPELEMALECETSTAQTHDKASPQNVDPISFSSDAFECYGQSEAALNCEAGDGCTELERGETASSMWTCRSSFSSTDAKVHLVKRMDSETVSSQTTNMSRCEALDSRDLHMPVLGRENSSILSSRTESKSSPTQSRMLSDAAVVECNDSISSNSSNDQNPIICRPSLNRFQSISNAGAVICETDDFVSTMNEFDDEVQQQKISSNLSGSTMSQTRCTSPNSFSSKIELGTKVSSSALLSAAMTDLDGPPLKQDCGDLLAEGIEHLSMAMLVNIYGKLREMSLLGHVSVKLRDIDVNSHQYNSRKKEMKRLGEWTVADDAKGYLDSTRNAGFIVRCVMDEAELFEAEHARGAENEFSHALLAYDAR